MAGDCIFSGAELQSIVGPMHISPLGPRKLLSRNYATAVITGDIFVIDGVFLWC